MIRFYNFLDRKGLINKSSRCMLVNLIKEFKKTDGYKGLLNEQTTKTDTSDKATELIPDVSGLFKEKLQQIIDDKESSVSERLGNIKFLLLNER